MKTNVLLQHVNPGQVRKIRLLPTHYRVPSPELANVLVWQVKCTTFQHPPEDKVFGAPRPLDPEGAREGISNAQA